ncbi:DUF2247 family protein [Aneurinibacillus aneurinilyticus]|jgi:hypothetical protein|uniref:DUF2247 family protein n=1 Tax=Aneurinibacillus aneurinilyticus TaxID=1391 RepID=UPI0023F698B9|nr:DUF2247 family protein [Aneurinibacillus aneurinilyticus]MCI1696916.1 DUF2247 family protein [Aneurinibacillus aneurinilyticus]
MSVSTDIFEQSKIHYDWKTLYVGLKLGLINFTDITKYAIDFLASHPDSDNQNIIQLAWGENDFDYEQLLMNLLKESNVDDLFPDSYVWEYEKRKWRFGILSYLKNAHQDDFEELLNKIAEVYADMDYPEDMEDFINYLTPKDGYNPSLYSHEENVARLVNLFNYFLDKEKQYFRK